jgi:phosphoglycolate phosphatase
MPSFSCGFHNQQALAHRMNDFPFAVIGFDLDGTLVDSSADIAAGANHVLERAGRPTLPVAELAGMIGNGSRVLLERAFRRTGGDVSREEMKRHIGVFMEFYGANLCVHTKPYPGCVETLDELEKLGCTLAVVTNKFESFASALLDQLGLLGRFKTVIGGDTLGPGRSKPEPDPIHEMMKRCGGGTTAFVGDTTTDVNATRAAGIPCVAVSFGFNDLPPHELGAQAVIEHFNALIPTLRTM